MPPCSNKATHATSSEHLSRAPVGPRKSGIELIGCVSWGAHFCQFYQTQQDLTDILVPYFEAGLRDNEFCMWITSEPLDEHEAEAALRRAVPDLDRYIERGQIEIIPHDRWYTLGGSFDSDRVLAGWVEKLDGALARGFSGLRLTGNTFWLEKSDWQDFTDYEATINSVIGSYPMIAICTYSVDRCSASEVADVIANHQFALMKRAGDWSIIESSDYKHTRLALQESNAALTVANRRLEILSETASQLLASNSPQEVVQELWERVLDYLDCHAFFNYLVDEERGCLHLNACAGIPEDTAREIEWLDCGVAVCGCVARDGKRIVCERISETPDPRTDLVKSFGIQAYACHPLLGDGGKVIGTLSFGTRTRPTFSEEDLSLMRTVADQVAISMERMRLLEADRRAARAVEAANRDLQARSDELAELNEELRITNEELSQEIAVRRRAEADLEETRSYLENLIDYANAPIIVWDPSYRITQFNHAFEWLTGYVADEVLGKPLSLLFPHETRAESLDKIALTAGGEYWQSVEIPILRKDGTVRIALWNSANILSPDGATLAATIAQGQDITERKQAEEELEETRGYLENLIDYANAPIIVWDPQSRITQFNHAFERLTGYSADEVMGRELSMLFPDASREESLAEIARTVGGDYWESVEIPIRRKDGSVRIALWNSANILAPDGSALAATIAQGQDITERKRAETEAAEARADAERHAAELQSFISSMAEGFALFDTRACIRWMNDAALRILGIGSVYPYDDWLRDYRRFDLSGNPMSEEQSAVRQALAGETVIGLREAVVTPQGNRAIASVSASPVRDPSGRVVGATAVFRDVREVVELERRQEELYQREHHIAELLQRALIPPQYSYDAPGYGVSVKYQPALTEADVGGDFYDIFELADGKVGMMIGDVAGKGLLAAMRVSAARYAVRSYALVDPSPAKALRLANEALAREEADASGMLTLFFAVLDTANGTLRYASGGHEPPVLWATGGEMRDLVGDGAPLGVFEKLSYEEVEVTLRPEDTIVMVTDGITEARSADSRFFGREGVLEHLARAQVRSCEQVAEGLLSAAVEHAGGRLQDDAAIVVFQLKSEPREVHVGG